MEFRKGINRWQADTDRTQPRIRQAQNRSDVIIREICVAISITSHEEYQERAERFEEEDTSEQVAI